MVREGPDESLIQAKAEIAMLFFYIKYMQSYLDLDKETYYLFDCGVAGGQKIFGQTEIFTI